MSWTKTIKGNSGDKKTWKKVVTDEHNNTTVEHWGDRQDVVIRAKPIRINNETQEGLGQKEEG